MNKNQILDSIKETLVWQSISDEVERIDQLHAMLVDIHYLERKEEVVSSVTRCEVFDSESCDVEEIESKEDELRFTFTMSFILSAWNQDQQVLRLSGNVIGQCSMQDVQGIDWEQLDFESMDLHTLRGHRTLLQIETLQYESMECDDVSLL